MSASTYLTTLRRVPKAVVLSLATREFQMGYHGTCLCGWAVRESLGALLDVDPAAIDDPDALTVPGFTGMDMEVQARCVVLYGGTRAEWDRLFIDVCYTDRLADVELAFVRRVAECAR